MIHPPSFSQADITRERWVRGRLNYKLHSGQLIIEERVQSSKNQLFVGEIARQFGKSFWLVKTAIETAIRKPKARIKYATAFYTDLVEFIIPAFETVLADCPEDLKPKWSPSKSKFIFSNGSEIKLVGLDRKPNGLRGNVIDLIILDEAGFMSRLDYIYRSVIIPATTHRPDCRILAFSTPPDTPAHEFLDYVQKAEYEGGYLKLTIYQNPLCNEATIARLMKESGGENSTTWRREYLCEHVTDEDLAIIREWNELYVQEINRDVFYPFYLKYNAMDLGIKRDFTAVLFGHYDFQKATLFIEDEYVVNGPDVTTPLLEKKIKEIEAKLWGNWAFIHDQWVEMPVRKNLLRYSDNNNPLLLQDLSLLHKLHFTATDKGTLDEMVNAVRVMAGKGQIVVDPSCKQLKGCLKYGVWDKNRDKFARSKVYGHFDALSALVYLVRNLNKTTNPIPVDFQLDSSNQLLIRGTGPTESASVLKSAFGIK